MLLFLGLWLVGRGIVKFKRFKAAGGEAKKNSLGAAIAEKREVIASFVALVIYVGLMDLVGFVIMTVLYTFAQILILTPREKWKKNFVPAGIVALVAGFLLYYLFKVQLNVLLPAGILPLFGV